MQPAQLNAGERLAARRGYGDGLFQATAGIDVALGRRFGFVGELRYFVPMQNDPGDGYHFVDSRIIALGLRYQSR